MTAAPRTFVIVGASLAGAKAAEALGGQGFDGRLLLVGEESEPPYERAVAVQGATCSASRTARRSSFTSRTGSPTRTSICAWTPRSPRDQDRRAVTISGGERISYDKLLLATGASPRRIPVPGAFLGGVLYLRLVGDCEQIKDTFGTASRVVFIGGGWIGLEVAAAAREAGVKATVLEAGELPLPSLDRRSHRLRRPAP